MNHWKEVQRVKMLYLPVVNMDVEPPVREEPDFFAADKALDALIKQVEHDAIERTRREVVSEWNTSSSKEFERWLLSPEREKGDIV